MGRRARPVGHGWRTGAVARLQNPGAITKRVLAGMGIEPGRVKLVWASAAEGARFASETTLFVEEIRKLGPLNWGKAVDGGPLTVDDNGLLSTVDGPKEEVPA